MTRRELEEEYEVKNGVISTPGKFEAEPLYVPYFWDVFLNGFADEDDGDVLGFEVNEEDRQEFPELAQQAWVWLYEDDQGFVSEVNGPSEEEVTDCENAA